MFNVLQDDRNEKFSFFCHDGSLTPRQLVEISKNSPRPNSEDPFRKFDPIKEYAGIFVNDLGISWITDWGSIGHAETPFSAKWKTSGHDIILTDPSWKVDVPPKGVNILASIIFSRGNF